MADDRFGSFASDGSARRVRGMSAVPPIAPEFVHCSDLTESAISGLVQCSKIPSLDHLVGATEQRERESEAERPRGLHVDNQLQFRDLLHW
jgi:hypothetical protein